MSKTIKVLAMLSLLTAFCHAQDVNNRFAKHISTHAAAAAKLSPGVVMAVGSSTYGRWKTMAEDFAIPIYNAGISGRKVEDMLNMLDTVVIPAKPSVIVYFCGGNNIGNSSDPKREEIVLEGFKKFVYRVNAALPHTRIIYQSINPTLARAKAKDLCLQTNARIKEFCATDPRLGFVDTTSVVLDENDSIREEAFVEDRLHPNQTAYTAFVLLLKPAILAAEKAAKESKRSAGD